MHILVTGTDGYIGAVLAPLLMQAGHQVTGIDAGFYRQGLLFNTDLPMPKTLTKDIRRIVRADLAGVDGIVHLAELSNDPLGQNDPEITFEINHQGSVALAKLARECGIQRFVYTSSCSVYGAGGDEARTEESPVNPQTAYAHCKVLVERDVGQLAGETFSPTFLRNATAFGPSPRMRFDIVLNDLCGIAWTQREIRMKSDGSPWRPLVHVADICDAILACLEAPREAVHNEIFNVGADAQNYRVREIAEIVAETFPACVLTIGKSGGDNRSYRVAFGKLGRHLPKFTCTRSANFGAAELKRCFTRIAMTKETFEAAPFTRLKQLSYLLATQQLDRKLFWRE